MRLVMKLQWLSLPMILSLAPLVACSQTDSTATYIPPTPPAQRWQYSEQPPMTIDTATDYTATIHTDMGDLVIQLFPTAAPVTVNNFVFLAEEGFYDGVTFHRVIQNCMIQGGHPVGNGTGGPGTTSKTSSTLPWFLTSR